LILFNLAEKWSACGLEFSHEYTKAVGALVTTCDKSVEAMLAELPEHDQILLRELEKRPWSRRVVNTSGIVSGLPAKPPPPLKKQWQRGPATCAHRYVFGDTIKQLAQREILDRNSLVNQLALVCSISEIKSLKFLPGSPYQTLDSKASPI
jgi:hypothetical protein